jgi:hypothetical protein
LIEHRQDGNGHAARVSCCNPRGRNVGGYWR